MTPGPEDLCKYLAMLTVSPYTLRSTKSIRDRWQS